VAKGPALASRLLKWSGLPMDSQSSGEGDRPMNTLSLKAILVVDDDKQLASALQWILADENYLVDVAYDGEEAILKVKVNEYDAIICDLMMPRLRGDEFYVKANEIRPNLADHFIFITSYAADPAVNSFLKGDNIKYLVKPFPVEVLINCVQQLLRT
jgi:DNA-binding response OmpR family regulator